jgi:dolichyl-phosphate-mannose--protein O-mannosyl transferase
MGADFSGTPRTDPSGSAVWEWPLARRSINYRWDSDGVHTSYVQLVGNEFSWLMALVAPLAALALLLQRRRPPAPPPQSPQSPQPAISRGASVRHALMLMILAEYVAFMAMNALLGQYRVLYLYHYFIGLVLAFTLLPLIYREVSERWSGLKSWQTPVLAAFTVLQLGSFVFYSPLSSHQPLTHAQCERRNVVQHVVDCRP